MEQANPCYPPGPLLAGFVEILVQYLSRSGPFWVRSGDGSGTDPGLEPESLENGATP